MFLHPLYIFSERENLHEKAQDGVSEGVEEVLGVKVDWSWKGGVRGEGRD